MTPSPSAEIEKAMMSLIRAKDENVVEKILEDKFFAVITDGCGVS